MMASRTDDRRGNANFTKASIVRTAKTDAMPQRIRRNAGSPHLSQTVGGMRRSMHVTHAMTTSVIGEVAAVSTVCTALCQVPTTAASVPSTALLQATTIEFHFDSVQLKMPCHTRRTHGATNQSNAATAAATHLITFPVQAAAPASFRRRTSAVNAALFLSTSSVQLSPQQRRGSSNLSPCSKSHSPFPGPAHTT